MMKIACIQPKIQQSTPDCYKEITQICEQLILSESEIDLIILPERWTPLFKYIPQNFQEERGENYQFIKSLSKDLGVRFLSGAIWEKRNDSKKPFITCYYLDSSGNEIGRQDKIHLYSYEAKFFNTGDTLNLFQLNGYYIAILICFDMAFFETPRLAVEHNADLLLSPTQIREDGMDNWAIYLQARALENRVPVVACNTVGKVMERRFLGGSKIISFENGFLSPSKLKVKEAPIGLSDKSSCFIIDDINLDFPRKMRAIRLNEKIEKSKIKIKIN